ncbi:transmembrane protein 230 isoform X1 [Bubalus kerabau]|uniref:transmembrane protein 230 isoform X1 n=1 Tax=Bubalus carabanensis TaxID=3119969 RepID=UPI00244ED544|nr:transmembrane protein 230 isoform X1 [Bubalus carabanensis]XP_055400199.1 transmembrane protein 230 isoform X1 [Bubalus carabanensis]
MMATLTFREKLTAKASRLWESSFFPDVMRSNLLKFKKSPPKIPYKAIALATVLFLIGAFLIIIGSLLLAGYISKGILFSDNKMLLPLSLNKLLSDPMRWVWQGADRAVPVLIIGILVFLPGFYHLRIAYYASKGYRGYSYDDIPDFDD